MLKTTLGGRVRRNRLIELLVVFGFMVFTDAHAGGVRPDFTKPLPPTQRVFIDNANLTAEDFFSAYMSKSVEERRYAELYLLGVMDSTEGKSWCDYRTFKTITIGEEIFLGFKALEKSKQDSRAAYVITDILSNKFPCRRE
jgi:hypothetical protein